MISDPKGESDCEEGKHEPKTCPGWTVGLVGLVRMVRK